MKLITTSAAARVSVSRGNESLRSYPGGSIAFGLVSVAVYLSDWEIDVQEYPDAGRVRSDMLAATTGCSALAAQRRRQWNWMASEGLVEGPSADRRAGRRDSPSVPDQRNCALSRRNSVISASAPGERCAPSRVVRPMLRAMSGIGTSSTRSQPAWISKWS